MMAFILATDFDFIAYMSKMAFFWKFFSCQWRFWNMIVLSDHITKVSDQNGISQACYIVEIHHSGREPLIICVKHTIFPFSEFWYCFQ